MKAQAKIGTREPWPLTIGAVLWSSVALLAAFGQAPFGLIEVLFLLAPLVVVPLCFPLTDLLEQRAGLAARADGAARAAQPWAAVAALVAFFLPSGQLGAGLSLPWLAVCALVGLAGFVDLLNVLRERRVGFAGLALIAARLYLSVGGGWLVISRLGATPMHFGEPIVLLTAVHFHYAGFAAAIILAAAWRFFEAGARLPRKLFLISAAGILAGPALLAAGFVISPLLQMAAALLLSAAQAMFGVLLISLLPRLQPKLARALVGIAGATVVFAMLLSVTYAWGEYTREYFILILRMAALHGTANAFGFTLAMLVAWKVAFGPCEAESRREA